MPTPVQFLHSIATTVVYNTLIAAVADSATQALTIIGKRHNCLDDGKSAPPHERDVDSKREEGEIELAFDETRVLRFAFSVGTVGAVLGTIWYEGVIPSVLTASDYSMLTCAKKALLSNTVFMPIANACQLSCLSLLEHGKVHYPHSSPCACPLFLALL